MNQIILEYVEDARAESEIDVLLAIGEGYSKILTIANENGFENLDTIMESFGIFMESDSSSDDNSSGNKTTSSIKALFTKIINFIKEAFRKISGVFKRRFVDNKKNIYLAGNVLRIMDALEKVEQPNRPNPVNEYDSSDIFSDEDIYQEGLFKPSKAKREADKTAMAFRLKRTYAKEMNLKELTMSDIKGIVDAVTNNLSKEEFKKLKTAIKSFKEDTWPQFDEGVIRNAAMLLEMSNSLGKIRSKMDEMTKPGYLSKLGSRANAEEDKKVQKNIDRQISKNGIDKVEQDLKLIENFAETFGKALNYISKRDNFSVANCKRIVYGGHPIKQGLASTADCLFGIFNRTSKILPDINKYGELLYDAHESLSDYVKKDERIRNTMNIKMNKVINKLMFVLDAIKEETYGWEDDPFNKQSYGGFNIYTLNAGGPFTIAYKLIMVALTKDPSWMGTPGDITPDTLVAMGVAKALKPTSRKG